MWDALVSVINRPESADTLENAAFRAWRCKRNPGKSTILSLEMQKNPGMIQRCEIGNAEKLWKIQHFELGDAGKPWKIQHCEICWKMQHFEIGNTEKAENPAILKFEFEKKEFEQKKLKLAEKD